VEETTSLVQYVDPTGAIRPDLTDSTASAAAGITAERARKFYRLMVVARRVDDEAFALQRQGQLGLWLQSRGQEAAQVGAITAVRDTDYVFPSYREHAAALTRGLSPAQLMLQWRGNAHSGWDPRRFRYHVNTLVLAAQMPQAVGYARGVMLDSSDEVVLTFFGDGAASEGDAAEAFNLAAVLAAPVVFFCQNNQWAISTPTEQQMAAPIHRRAAGYGIRSAVVDGNDVFAVHAVTSELAASARAGEGPVLVEAITYRMGGHSTSDDPTRYRHDATVQEWVTRDPITRVRLLLERQNWADGDFFAELDAEADEMAAQTRAACLSFTDPALVDMFEHVWSQMPPTLVAERHELLRQQEALR
jgi:2-oxoisovalerate dehydrogenase E1 component alpha subunit